MHCQTRIFHKRGGKCAQPHSACLWFVSMDTENLISYFVISRPLQVLVFSRPLPGSKPFVQFQTEERSLSFLALFLYRKPLFLRLRKFYEHSPAGHCRLLRLRFLSPGVLSSRHPLVWRRHFLPLLINRMNFYWISLTCHNLEGGYLF